MLYEHTEPISLVVCGGSALNALNIARRTTRDVDVVAVVEESPEGIHLRYDRALPKAFLDIVADVGRDLGLPEDWLNMGPRDILHIYGVPPGMTERLERTEYGPSLTVYFVGRLEQVHFKLLAASDPQAEHRHLEDLIERIKPTDDEVKRAVGWLLGRETSSWFRGNVKRAVEELGYDDISRSIPA
jgi:hypothetical protein